MSQLIPFRALRPAPEAASAVASVPYDVVNADEARALAAGQPKSFLRVTRAEIDLPPDVNPYDDAVYAQAVRNLEELKRAAPLVLDAEPTLYLYRLQMGTHVQTGVAGCFPVDEYDRGLIKKHEKTRKDKEDDRTRHIVETRAQTGVVFLTYHASAAVDRVVAGYTGRTPLYNLTAPDGVVHTVWQVAPADVTALVNAFADLPALYIADGHHRAASAARARAALRSAGGRSSEADGFIAVAIPDSQVQILAYNRIVKDLAGLSPDAFLGALGSRVKVSEGTPVPARAGVVSMYLAGRWHALTLPAPPPGTSRADGLDVEVLHRTVLAPVLHIGDVRTDKRIDFCGGIRGTGELERLVDAGKAAVAFSMFPVSVEDLMAIADAGGIMPPKSTWFEPKLRDGLLVHLI
ncbi:MAG TPA: DUF1015 family protein [Vicinamibacterales bacterium]|nr:DUF1015 family protein [Vicinamibacterales bacterium]